MSDYLARIAEASRAGVLPPGEVTSVEVEHAPGCPHADNRSAPCVCHPRITALVAGEVLVIGSGGVVIERSKPQ